jgi:tetratricopeptide (TPR) repeat protein
MVGKAKALLAKAEQNLADRKQAEAASEAERKRRTDLIVAGAGECSKENWQACKDKLATALEGAEKIFGQQDAALTTKAKALKAKAQEQLDSGKRQSEAEAKRNMEQENAKKLDEQHKKQCNAMFDQADAKYEAKDYQGSVTSYRKLLELCPDNCSAMNNLGLSLKSAGNVQESLSWYEKAARCDPSRSLYAQNVEKTKKQIAEGKKEKQCSDMFEKAKGKSKADDRSGAIADYKAVLALCPDYCGAMNNIGAQLDNLGEKQNALSWFEKAAKCDPDKELYQKNVRTTRQEIAEKRQSANNSAQQLGQALTQLGGAQQGASRPNTSPPSSPPPATTSMDGTYNGTFSSPVFKGKVKVRIQGAKVTGVATDSSGAQVDFEGTLKRQTGEISCFLVYRGKSSGGQGNAKGNVRNGSIEGSWAFFTLEAKPTEYKGTWTASK